MTGERRVVITGLGVVSPMGIGREALWDGLITGRSVIGPVQAFDASNLQSCLGGEVAPFKISQFVPKSLRKNAKVMARDIELAVVAAYEAVKDAGLKTRCLIDRGEVEGPPNVDPTRFGANIGAGLICTDLDELACAFSTAVDENGDFSLAKWGRGGMENLTPLWLLRSLPNMLACHVTIVQNAQAPSNTLTCGEASSHLAIGEAFRSIARGVADVCICGGAESKINPMAMVRAALLGRVDVGSDEKPESACRPFAADRAGTVCSEGGGLVTLEDLDHARQRGARIYAELVGFGASANTHSWSEPDPDGRGIARAIRSALSDAGVGASDIDLIVTFGTGVADQDASEAAAFADVFGPRLESIPAIATKGSLGTNGAGSGALDFAVGVMSMVQSTVVPSRNTEHAERRFGFRFVQGDPVDARIGHLLTVGYTLGGGQNAAIVVRRVEE
ncbi:MAG: beta-ketoacyl-[acyl-carrier-protein] synthase family protein [Planctomycetes bacterium]|nr:beta-ketoacyl-[acyl-carrier-protein] synthase family protein [Planctomycetota bacterium]